MIMLLIISGTIMPAFMWLILYFNIVDQYIEIDGEPIMTETKAEAQKIVLMKTLKHPFFWIYVIYALAVVSVFVVSYNIFGSGCLI